MKHIPARMTALAAALLTAVGAFPGMQAQAETSEPIRIMPLGDSITDGFWTDGGYRKYLDFTLQQKGCHDYDLVGPQGADQAVFTYQGQEFVYDNNHAGWSGYAIRDLPGGFFGKLNGIYETLENGDYMAKYRPDIILLQIGTNDISQGHLDGSEERLHELLDYLLAGMAPGGTIFLSTIPDMGGMFGGSMGTDFAAYNALVERVGREYAANEKPVRLADIHSVIDPAADLYDGVHPNEQGYEKMGLYWADVLDAFWQAQSAQTPPEQPADVTGDLNGDGSRSVADLLLLQKWLLGEGALNNWQNGDMNRDGLLNAVDSTLLKRQLLV